MLMQKMKVDESKWRKMEGSGLVSKRSPRFSNRGAHEGERDQAGNEDNLTRK
jgi:hypothetical protein